MNHEKPMTTEEPNCTLLSEYYYYLQQRWNGNNS